MNRKQLAEIVEDVMSDNAIDPADHEDFVTDLLDRLETETGVIDEEDDDEDDDEEEGEVF